MHRSTLALSPLLLLISACTSAPPCEPLPAGRAVELHHVSRLGPARVNAPAAPGGLASEPKPSLDAGASFVRIDLAQYELEPDALGQLVGAGGPVAFARIASRDEVGRVLEACVAQGAARRVSRPSIRVYPGGTASMSTLREQAFVEGFEISRAGSAVLGDPRVATTQEGISVSARARSGNPRALAIDLTIEQTELLRPLLESGVHVAGTSTGLVVQVPLAIRQEMTTAVELADGEVLVLGGMRAREGDHDLLFVVDARRDGGAEIGDAGPAAMRAASAGSR